MEICLEDEESLEEIMLLKYVYEKNKEKLSQGPTFSQKMGF